ncbi:hypothetical protein [Marinitoga lauensis]|uniref:hypothetical protein n=1 Tax=Marinitoga lauensis TaxID=2201189 RepID=UPI00101201DC|nr:hypothetical protein [Marinitoga lauensis]
MNKLKIKFRNCYGIKNLEHEFEFIKRVFAIYAPNGVMKTSFAKTFKDFSEDKETKDLVFTERRTIREIIPIEPDNIFVIESYVRDFNFDKVSTLVVNKNLRKEYENIHKDINKVKANLIKELKILSGINSRNFDVEKIVKRIFGLDFFDFILENEKIFLETEDLPYYNVEYQKIFNDKVRKFLETEDFKLAIKEYIEKYYELIDKSPYLKKDFNFYHAENVQKQLTSNNFFKAGHSVNLFNGNKKIEYKNSEELKKLLEEEKNKIFENNELQIKFDKIDKKLSNNADLRNFRNYLLDNKEILPELVNLEEFEKKIWLSYFINKKELTLNLINHYKHGQGRIKKIINKAKEEQTDWEEVIKMFNIRFSHLPFYLKIKNKADVILKDDVPVIEFIFKDGEFEKTFEEKDELLKVLSTGEQRALYILNIIFNVEIRKKHYSETLFIIDDIADSFDYKNKYAIIEYLKYMSEINNFYMIILTHNFDFYRTIESRGVVGYKNCLMAIKNNEEIKLEKAKYIKNPFANDWKKNLDNNKKLIASIPFIRNIVEYTQGEENDDYLLLTSALHHKNKTEEITLKDIKNVIEKYIRNAKFQDIELENKIIDIIFETADLCLNEPEGINLENKIILSIAIRLKAEIFMKSKISNKEFLNNLDNKKKQTWELIKEFEKEYSGDEEVISILKRVNLMTPENIHVNSFMYEPILDMGDYELRGLYKEVKNLDVG